MATAFPFPFPDGVRFCHSDKEIVASYLCRRAQGLPFFPGLMIDFDVYSCEPWKLPSCCFIHGKDGVMFFFTPRYSVSADRRKNASRFHVRRTAGEGSWESNGCTKPICDGEDIIGTKMALVFKIKNKAIGAATKTNWMMQEYLLHSPSNQFQELALCKIYWNGKKDVDSGQGTPLLKKRKTNSEPLYDASCFEGLDDMFNLEEWLTEEKLIVEVKISFLRNGSEEEEDSTLCLLLIAHLQIVDLFGSKVSVVFLKEPSEVLRGLLC